MALPLSRLCVNVVATEIANGTYELIDDLNSLTSSQILSRLEDGNPHALKAFRLKKLRKTEVSTAGKVFNIEDIEMAAANEISSLHLVNLKKNRIFHVRTGDAENTISVDAIKAMKRLLNEKSRQNLLQLTVNGSYVKLDSGWIEDLRTLTPSLKSLNLQYCNIGNKEFRTICENFTQLTQLSIQQTKIESLEGIEKMKNLEILCISDVRFDNVDDVKPIFGLQNLKVLDVSSHSNERLNTAYLLFKCDQIFPNLRFVDFAGNHTPGDLLVKFIKNHEKLEKVSLIDTAFENRVPTLSGRVQCLSLQNLASCTNSLKYYKTHGNHRKCLSILRSIQTILRNNPDDFDGPYGVATFHLLLDVLDKRTDNKCRYTALKLLFSFIEAYDDCTEIDFNRWFSVLIRVLAETTRDFKDSNKTTKLRCKYAWRCFAEANLSSLTKGEVFRLCELGAIITMKSFRWEDGILEPCYLVLVLFFGNLEDSQKKILLEKYDLNELMTLFITT